MTPALSPARLHAASLLVSFAFWAYLDRHLWFFDDEWQFLVGRGLWYAPTDPRSIWYPHFEHWSTLPILLWRALYSVFGLSTYWPYLLALLVTEVVVMNLLWRLCLRNGVDPWVAMAAVALLGLLGAGSEDLGWAFQVGFVGSLAFGLGAILLVDRPGPGPPQAHYALASLAALASLMCSSVGDAMAVALAVVLFARRPAKRAVAVLALPVAGYAVWWAFVGRLGLTLPGDHLRGANFTDLPGYVWTGLSTALGRSFDLGSAGATMLVALTAWLMWRLPHLLGRRPALAGLGAAAFVFYLLVGLGRDTAGDVGSTAPRYIYVAMALLLPAIAYALSPRADRRLPEAGGNIARAVAVVFLLATALGDVGQARAWATARVALVGGLHTEVTATARLLATGVRDATGPTAAPVGYSPDLTAAVLRRLGRSGLLGQAEPSPVALSNARALLATGITSRPRFRGRFYVAATGAVARWGGPAGCTTFAPLGAGAAGRVVLGAATAGAPASVGVTIGGVPPQIGAVLGPSQAVAGTVPAPLYLPMSGAAYLDDNDANAGLALEWGTGISLTLCDLVPERSGAPR